MGRALFPVYVALMQWGDEWTGLATPPADLLHKPCGHRVGVRVVCSECRQVVRPSRHRGCLAPPIEVTALLSAIRRLEIEYGVDGGNRAGAFADRCRDTFH